MASFPPDIVFDGSVSPVAPLIGRVALILAPSFGLLAPLPLQITPGQFLDVVHQAIQPPLHAHLMPAAQCEPAPALVVPDVAEHRTEGSGWTARMVAPVPVTGNQWRQQWPSVLLWRTVHQPRLLEHRKLRLPRGCCRRLRLQDLRPPPESAATP